METGRNQSVIVHIKLEHELLLRGLRKIDDLDENVFPFSEDDFHKHIHEIRQEHFVLQNPGFRIILHSFRHGGGTRDHMGEGRPLPELRKRDGGKTI